VKRTLTFPVVLCLSLCLAPTALAQTVTLTPSTLAFAAQPVGTSSAAKTVTLKNTSTTKSLIISSMVASGEFVETTSCTGTLAPGASCTLSVTYSPVTQGVIDGAVTVTDNASPGTQIVNLKGSGLAPLALSPPHLSFPSTPVGTTSAAQTVTLTNSTVALTMGTVTASGGFSISANNCKGTIKPGKTCTVGVTFTPTLSGFISGALSVADSGFGSPQVVSLSGTATGTVTRTVTFSPASLTFSSQPTGTSSVSQSVTLTNRGSGALSITSVAASGDYTETDTCAGQLIAKGKTCTINVTFVPTVTGTIKGAVTVVDAAATSPQIAALTGTGINALSFSPATLNFAGSIGVVSASQTATLTNNSSSTITPSNVAVSGDYQQTNTCGGSIAPGSSCAFSVTFAPLLKGTLDGAITVTASGVSAPQVLNLVGAATGIARYAYDVEKGQDWLVVGYSVNPETGNLRTLESLPVSPGSIGVTVDPSNKFLYIPDGPQILGYSIGANGLLQPLTGSPFQIIGGSVLDFTPDGKFVYSNFATEIARNSTTGSLTQIGSATPSAVPYYITMSPSGSFVYIPNYEQDTISGFTVDQATGALTPVTHSPFNADEIHPASDVVSPNGKFLFVATVPTTDSDGSTAVFSIKPGTGALTPVTGSPFATPSGGNGMAIDPTGQFLYIAGNTLGAYSIDEINGALTAISGSPYSLTFAANGATIDPTGKFLYLSTAGPGVITYSINPATGALSPIRIEGALGKQVQALTIATGNKEVVYTPKFAYVTNQGDQTISEWTINDGTGALKPVAGSPVFDKNGPQLIAAAPSGAFVYTGNANNSISEYKVNATNGALSRVSGSPAVGFGSVNALAVDPTSGFLFILDSMNQALDTYTIDPTTGALIPLSSVPASANSQTIVLDPKGLMAVVTSTTSVSTYTLSSGVPELLTSAAAAAPPAAASVDQSSQYIFVLEPSTNTVVTYGSSVDTGLSSAGTGNGASAVLAEPSGKYVYVANKGDGTISAYGLTNSTGALKQIGSPITAASGTDALSTSNDGKYLYATDSTAGLVSIFTINPDGSLTSAGSATTGTLPSSIATTGTNQ
jgi:6-phosphogluconolactonase (cycloisomerase 2 family)